MLKNLALSLIFVGLLSPTLVWAQAPTVANAQTLETPQTKELMTSDKDLVVIETNLGTMTMKLFPNAAPKMVAHFKKLVREGFYNGTKFHRVIPNFMIQGGSYNSKFADKSKWGISPPNEEKIPAEFHKNLHHVPGIVSAARTSDPNSATTQFFICVGTPSYLDGQYTIFGDLEDASSLDVAKKISEVKRDAQDHPLTDVVIKKVFLKAAAGTPAATSKTPIRKREAPAAPPKPGR